MTDLNSLNVQLNDFINKSCSLSIKIRYTVLIIYRSW